MTWAECKAAALRKMFGSDAGTIDWTDPSNADYLAAMPAAANEAIERLISTEGRSLRSYVNVRVPESPTVEMRDETDDFRSFGQDGPEVYHYTSAGLQLLEAASLGETVVRLPDDTPGSMVRICYDAQPPEITADTADDTLMPLRPDQNALIPLYMAGELYKDDDLTTATYYMNEFESRLAGLVPAETGIRGGAFSSVTGWW